MGFPPQPDRDTIVKMLATVCLGKPVFSKLDEFSEIFEGCGGFISNLGGQKLSKKWWISVDQRIEARHIQGIVMGPFSGSGMSIKGRHRAPKWLKKAIGGPFVAISRSDGSKLVD